MRDFFRYLKNEIYNIFHSKSFLIVLSILSVIVIIDSILAYFEYKNNLTITINNIAISDGVYESYPFLQLYTVYNSWIGGRVNTILTTVFLTLCRFLLLFRMVGLFYQNKNVVMTELWHPCLENKSIFLENMLLALSQVLLQQLFLC